MSSPEPVRLDELYRDAIAGRVAGLSTPGQFPDLPIVLRRCVDRLVAILAAMESGQMGDWDDDVTVLRTMAARWSLIADAYEIVSRRAEQ